MRAEYLGREVVAAAVKPLVDALLQHGVQPVSLPEITDAYDAGARISWQRLSDLLQQASTRLSEAQLKAVGAQGLHAPYYHKRLGFAKRFLTLEDTYRFMVYPHRVRDYECMHAAVSVEDGELRISVVLDPRYKPSQAFFTIMLGAAEALPAFFDQPDVVVHGHASGRCLHYEVALPTPHDKLSVFRARLSHIIRNTYHSLSQGKLYSELAERTFALEWALRERDVLLDRLAVDAGTHQRCMDVLDCVVVEYDHLNRVTHINQYAEQLFGHTRAELLRNPLLVLPAEDRPTAQNMLEAGAKPADGTYAVEALHADGRRIPLEIKVRSFVNERGEAGWLSMMREASIDAEPALVEAPSALNAPTDDIVVAESAPQAHILLFDADLVAQRITKRILQQAGFTVETAETQQQVLESLANRHPSAVVISERNEQLAASLDHQTDEIPVLWLVERSAAADQVHQWTVSKPFRAEDLVSLVREAIAA